MIGMWWAVCTALAVMWLGSGKHCVCVCGWMLLCLVERTAQSEHRVTDKSLFVAFISIRGDRSSVYTQKANRCGSRHDAQSAISSFLRLFVCTCTSSYSQRRSGALF